MLLQVEFAPLPGVLLFQPPTFLDHRGSFTETWNAQALREVGVDCDFVQDNVSVSQAQGTVRGLHCQAPPSAQAKLVRVIRGRIFDVAVDIRKNSNTYGHWFGVELSKANSRQLFIPVGFLHGFATLEDDCEVMYKCSAYYDAKREISVRFDDPQIAINWGLPSVIGVGRAILSQKDLDAPALMDLDSPF